MNLRLQSTSFKYLLLVILLSLNTCKNSEWQLESGSEYSAISSIYPFNNQNDVSLNTAIFISFSEQLDEDSLIQNFILTSENESVNGELYISPGHKFIRFIPADELLPLREYKINLKGLKNNEGIEFNLPEDGVVTTFTTGEGKIRKSGKLKVVSVSPNNDEVFDFSTFRLVFSEPVAKDSVVKGDSFKFQKIESGEEIQGTLIVRGTRLIFDPEQDLSPGEEYRLELTENIRGIDGGNLEPFEMNFFPLNTNPRTKISLKVSPDSDEAGPDIKNLPFSDIVGIPANVIEIDSNIIGKTYSIMKGILTSEMADLKSYSDFIPVVLRKGQRIIASSSNIKLGGEIDTLLDTGEISLTLLTDATGIIRGNPFKEYNKNFPPAVYFTLDACLTASNPKINAVLNQDNLDVQLFGGINLDGDNMIISTGGTTELDVMSAEKARVTLALRLITSTEDVSQDTISPAVLSTSPENGEEGVPVDSSVIVTFSEPIKESSITGRIVVNDLNGEITGTLSVEGSSVIFNPENPFNPSTVYTVKIASGIEDINGNVLEEESFFTFTTEIINSDNPQALLVSSIYPGVPCIFRNAETSPPGDAGECFDNDDDNKKFNKFILPSNREIIVYFTKMPAPESVTEESFVINDKETSNAVAGTRIISRKRVIFVPDEPWIIGRSYELILKGGSDTVCDIGEICDTNGLPLNTDILDDGSETPGGSDIVIPFIGVGPTDDSLLSLTLTKFSDTNSNGVIDTTPPQEVQYPENSVLIRNAADDSILGMTYLSGIMLSEIKGYDFSKDAVLLESLPGNWMFGTSTVIIILNSERMLMRPTGTATGYISEPETTDSDRRPILNIKMELWMNAVNDLADLALEDAPKLMELEGRIDFMSDGRMVAQLQNTNTVEISVLGGLITLRIKPGDVHVRAQAPIRF